MPRHRFSVLILCFALLLPALPAAAEGQEIADAGGVTYGLSAEEIAAYDAPVFGQLEVNQRLLHDRNYVRASGAVAIYDAPDGNVIETMEAGFNFFTTIQTVDGWTQIGLNRWVRAEAVRNVNHVVSNFTGVFLPEEPLEYPITWMLINEYASSYPGGPALETNRLLTRYTLMHIYDTVEVDGWRWYQVGPDEWIEQRGVAKYEPVERPEDVTTERWVSVNLYEQVLVAYEGETPVFTTLVSTGLPDFSTREGLYHVYVRYERGRMSWLEGTANFYYLQEVPWIQYFDGMIGLHGVYWHDGFGYRRSRGCVNLSITDAHWLYQWAGEVYTGEEPEEFAVYVFSSGEYVS